MSPSHSVCRRARSRLRVMSMLVLAALTVGAWTSVSAAQSVGTPPPAPANYSEFPLVMPVTGMVESLVGGGCPSARSHPGIDISSPLGTQTEIHAAYPGVARASYNGGYGLVVDVVHEFFGGSYLTRYAHLSATSVPAEGRSVAQGEVIGMMGGTGNAQIVHLHFELHRGDGSIVDLNPAFRPCRRQVVAGDPLAIDAPGLEPLWKAWTAWTATLADEILNVSVLPEVVVAPDAEDGRATRRARSARVASRG